MPSDRKESASFLPQSHGEGNFGSFHLLKLGDFAIGQYFPEIREESLEIDCPTSKIEAVFCMIEAHPIGEGEIELISLEIVLRNTKYMQARRESLDLEEILRRSGSWESIPIDLLNDFYLVLLLCFFSSLSLVITSLRVPLSLGPAIELLFHL